MSKYGPAWVWPAAGRPELWMSPSPPSLQEKGGQSDSRQAAARPTPQAVSPHAESKDTLPCRHTSQLGFQEGRPQPGRVRYGRPWDHLGQASAPNCLRALMNLDTLEWLPPLG